MMKTRTILSCLGILTMFLASSGYASVEFEGLDGMDGMDMDIGVLGVMGVPSPRPSGNPPPPPPVTRALEGDSTGTHTPLNPCDCQSTAVGRDYQQTGNFTSNLGVGTQLTSFHINWEQASQNGQGGFCAPISGSVVFTLAQGLINGTFSGTACELGAGVFAPLIARTQLHIVSGTGAFLNLRGTGLLFSVAFGNVFRTHIRAWINQ